MANGFNLETTKARITGAEQRKKIRESQALKKKSGEITSIAKPEKAMSAIDKASDMGAFTLNKTAQAKQDIATEETASGADPRTEFQNITSIEDQAKALIDQNKQELRAKEKSLFGRAITSASTEEDVDLFLGEQEEQKSRLEKEIEAANQADIASFEEQKLRAKGATASTEAAFGPNREGVSSAGNMMIPAQFKTRMNKQIRQSESTMQLNMEKRANLLKDLEKAQDRQKSEVAAGIIKEIAAAENQIRQEELRLAEFADKARSDAFDFLESAPAGSLQNMDIGTVAQTFGVDQATATMLVNMDTKKTALEAKQFEMDELDYAKKVTDLEISIQNAKFAGMTPEMKNFEHYKTLLWTDPASATEFAEAVGIKEKSFFGDFQQEWAGAQASVNQIWSEQGVIAPPKSKYKFDIIDGGISFRSSAPEGQPLPSNRRQCGEWVNDVLNGGPGLFGNSFENKKSKVNSKFPVAGGAFVERTDGQIGHVGMVEKTYPDMSFDIRETNYRKNEKDVPIVTTAHITPDSPRWKTIVEQGGFYVPGGAPESAKGTTSIQDDPRVKMLAQGYADGKVDDALLSKFLSGNDLAYVAISSLGLSPTVGSPNYEKAQKESGAKDLTKISQAANSIISPLSTMTINDVPQEIRADVEAELVIKRQQALKDGNFEGLMYASAGGKDPGESFKNQFRKSLNVVGQMNGLAGLFAGDKGTAKEYAKNEGIDYAPFKAWFKKKNLWDSDAQAISASINGIIPNLARGVFGEVGVLTDKDIEQYSKVVPNLSQPEQTRKVVSALLMTNLKKSIETLVQSEAQLGGDVSGAVALYQDVNRQIESINRDLGIYEPSPFEAFGGIGDENTFDSQNLLSAFD